MPARSALSARLTAVALAVFLVILAALGELSLAGLPILLIALPLQVALTLGLGLLICCVHTLFRDTVQMLSMAMMGWFYLTPIVYPRSLVPPEFEGRSSIGPYGDAIMELDYRTGEVLDAISAAGIEDNTIVIWISDNAATPLSGPPAYRGGNNGPFRGELGDAEVANLLRLAHVHFQPALAGRVRRGPAGVRVVVDD